MSNSNAHVHPPQQSFVSAAAWLICRPILATSLSCLAHPLIPSTEFCERGSLADLLARARQDPTAAAALPWLRRLSMVGWGTAAGGSACFSALGLVPRTGDCLLANTAVPAPATCRHLMPPVACCTCTLAPCRCCTVT